MNLYEDIRRRGDKSLGNAGQSGHNNLQQQLSFNLDISDNNRSLLRQANSSALGTGINMKKDECTCK